jgi:ribosomal protein L35AE/L33A
MSELIKGGVVMSYQPGYLGEDVEIVNGEIVNSTPEEKVMGNEVEKKEKRSIVKIAWMTAGGSVYEGEVVNIDSNVGVVRCSDGVTRVVELTDHESELVSKNVGRDVVVHLDRNDVRKFMNLDLSADLQNAIQIKPVESIPSTPPIHKGYDELIKSARDLDLMSAIRLVDFTKTSDLFPSTDPVVLKSATGNFISLESRNDEFVVKVFNQDEEGERALYQTGDNRTARDLAIKALRN